MPLTDPDAYRAYQNQHQRSLAGKWRGHVLRALGGKCAVCGGTEKLIGKYKIPDPDAPKVSMLWSYGAAKRKSYLRKAELRCQKHQRDVETKHGTTAVYRQGCRCDDCVAAKRKYVSRWNRAQIRKRTIKDQMGL